jgi:RNA polymerase sigma-70 factor (ECF subfamily)
MAAGDGCRSGVGSEDAGMADGTTTDGGGPATGSPSATRWSVVAAASAPDAAGRKALGWLCRRYWDPLCAHARRRGWGEAEDAVQDFLTDLIERGAIAQADRERGRFWAWLFVSFNNALANRAAAAQALKRGGRLQRQQMDEADLPAAAAAADGDAAFDRDWALTVLGHAQDRLAAEQADSGRWQALRPFLAANGDAAAYRAAGAGLGLGEGAVKVAIHRLRSRLRELVREGVAETLMEDDPRVIDAELDHLIAVLSAAR